MSATPQELGNRDELDSPRVTRIEMGTNILQALIVNGSPLVAVTDEGGLFVDQTRAEGFTYTITEGTAMIGGGTEIDGVPFDADPGYLSIGGNVIQGQTLNRLLVRIEETGNGPIKVNFAVE